MFINESRYYKNLDIKIKLGNLLIDVIYIHFVMPSASWKVQNHCHSSYELHFIPYGNGSFVTNNKSYELNPGSFYLTGPDVFHEQASDSKNPMAECCVNFDYKILPSSDNSSIPAKEISEIVSLLKNNNFWYGNDQYNNLELFQRLHYELENRLVGYYLSTRNYISQIIINSLRCIAAQKADYTPPIKTLNDSRRDMLDNFFAFRYNDITIEEASKSLGISSRQLDRILHEYYSMSFTEKLLDTRIKNAMHMLKSSSLNIEDISQRLGFNSASYFCRAFKKVTGVAPSRWEKD